MIKKKTVSDAEFSIFQLMFISINASTIAGTNDYPPQKKKKYASGRKASEEVINWRSKENNKLQVNYKQERNT